ncbi:MAG: HAD family hydrolase, partial [Chloroflexota bacterium]
MTGLKRKPFDIIAFDADDTLWHNETLYTSTKDRFFQLLAKYHSPETIASQLEKTELRNLDHFGYGIKGFTLSMIETAIEMTGGRILGSDIQKIIDFAREMLSANIQLFEHVQDTIPSLAQEYPLMLITKGDLFDQETKIARSGIGGYFTHVEIV